MAVLMILIRDAGVTQRWEVGGVGRLGTKQHPKQNGPTHT